MSQQFNSFQEFWPFYLSQHHTPICRGFHYLGTLIGIALCAYFIHQGKLIAIPLSFIPGYGLAWIGHFGFEHNKPAAFRYTRWSFFGDFKMLFYFFTGKISSEIQTPEVKRFLN